MKYSAEMIKNIKRDYADKSISRLIMEKYNASYNTIYRIANSRGVKRPRRISRNPDLWEEF